MLATHARLARGASTARARTDPSLGGGRRNAISFPAAEAERVPGQQLDWVSAAASAAASANRASSRGVSRAANEGSRRSRRKREAVLADSDITEAVQSTAPIILRWGLLSMFPVIESVRYVLSLCCVCGWVCGCS